MNGLPTTAAMAQFHFQQQQQGQARQANPSGSDAGNSGQANNNTTITSAGSSSVAKGSSVRGHLPSRPGPSSSVSPPDPNGGTRSSSLMSETSSSQPGGDVHPFFKESSGRYVVLYSYRAQDENDVGVERGQCVTVLNSDDPDWYWVARYDGCEGFVPSGFIYPLDAIQRQRKQRKTMQ